MEQGYQPGDELICLAEDMLAYASELRSMAERLALTATGARQRAARSRRVQRKPALRLVSAGN